MLNAQMRNESHEHEHTQPAGRQTDKPRQTAGAVPAQQKGRPRRTSLGGAERKQQSQQHQQKQTATLAVTTAACTCIQTCTTKLFIFRSSVVWPPKHEAPIYLPSSLGIVLDTNTRLHKSSPHGRVILASLLMAGRTCDRLAVSIIFCK